MIGPTRPFRPLPLSGILAIAGTLATLSVLAVPAANVSAIAAESTSVERSAPTEIAESRVQQDGAANLEAVGREVGVVFTAVEAVAATAVN